MQTKADDLQHQIQVAQVSFVTAASRLLDDAEEVLTIGPRSPGAGEPKVGLVHERRRLQGLARTLPPHVRAGKAPKLVVHLDSRLACRGGIGRGWAHDLSVIVT